MNRARIRELAEQHYSDWLLESLGESLVPFVESAILAALTEALSEEPSEAMLDALTDRMWRDHTVYTVWSAMAAAKLKEMQG